MRYPALQVNRHMRTFLRRSRNVGCLAGVLLCAPTPSHCACRTGKHPLIRTICALVRLVRVSSETETPTSTVLPSSRRYGYLVRSASPASRLGRGWALEIKLYNHIYICRLTHCIYETCRSAQDSYRCHRGCHKLQYAFAVVQASIPLLE